MASATADPPGGIARERWLRPVLGALVLTVLYRASGSADFGIGVAGGGVNGVGAVAGMPVVALLSVGAAATAVAIAGAGAVSGRALVGGDRARHIGWPIAAQVGFVVVGLPILVAVSEAVGLRGSTVIHLHHRTWAYTLLISWLAVLVAPWMEEASMRGMLLPGLWARFGFWPAAFASSFAWAALHGVAGVLIPFTFEGVVLCWARRRTGSIRVGVGLHAAQNTFASAVAGGGWTVIPAVAAVVVSLVATRTDPETRLRMRVAPWTAAAVRGTGRLSARLERRSGWAAPWWACSAAGAAWLAGIALEGAEIELGYGRTWLLTAGQLVIALAAVPVLAGYLLAARRRAGGPAAGAVAGALGAAVLAVVRVAGVATGALQSLAALAYVLIAFAVLGFAVSAAPPRARAAAGVAGVCLCSALAPTPYLPITRSSFAGQSLALLTATALAVVAIGAVARRANSGFGFPARCR